MERSKDEQGNDKMSISQSANFGMNMEINQA